MAGIKEESIICLEGIKKYDCLYSRVGILKTSSRSAIAGQKKGENLVSALKIAKRNFEI